MTFADVDAADWKCRVAFVLIALLSLAVLGGCGGGWQDEGARGVLTRPAVEGSGVNGPVMEDSRTHL